MPINSKIRVDVLQHSAEPEKVAALAAKLCYSSADLSGLQENVSNNDQADFIDKIASMGHYSVFEHVSFTFGVEGVSRTLTHQLVRHRVASYSQKSQRYVKVGGELEVITPESVRENSDALTTYNETLETIEKAYAKLIDLGIKAEDARYLLPNATETKIIITMNARELIHFFAIRSCNRAQWEIRELSDLMLKECYRLAPAIFKKAGPSCCFGKCAEGVFTCGQASEVKQRIQSLKSGEQ